MKPKLTELERDNLARVKAIRARLKRCPRVPTDWSQAAIAYAMWLAKRDGITIPTDCEKPRAVWSGVNKLRGSKWIFERRIRAVSWGHEKDVYNTRKNGKRGAFLYRAFEAELTIELPHWDWQPEVFDESVILEDAA
jgi:hypothetical protein